MNGEELSQLNVLGEINPLLTDIGIAIIILLLGFIIGKITGIILEKILIELQVDKGLKAIRKKKLQVRKGLPLLISILIYAAAVVLALTHLGILETVLKAIAALAILIIVGSMFLWIANLLPNIIAGFKLRSRRNFTENNVIRSKLVEGKIKRIGFLKTRIESNEDTLIIPNYSLTKKKSPIGKYSVAKK